MKKILALATIILSACITAPEEQNIAVEQNSSIEAVSSQVVMSSSSQMILSSSSQAVSSSSFVPLEPTFIAEIGYVCNGFNTQATSPGRATEGFVAMYEICGDMATMTTGTQPRVAEVIADWMIFDLGLDQSFTNLILSDLTHYESSLRFYTAVDGYIRYFYIEPVGDGRGLMRKIN